MVLKQLGFFAFATVIVCGCSNLFGPHPDEPKPLVQKSQSTCIKDVPKNLKAWLADGSTDIGGSVDCAVGALDEFSRRVKGQTQSGYSAGELNEFIADFLTEANSVEAAEVRKKTVEILKFKQVVFGGSPEFVTRDEIARLRSVLVGLRPFLVHLTPNIKTILFNSPSATMSVVTSATDDLKGALNLIAGEFERSESGRPTRSFDEFLRSAHVLGLQNDSVREWLPLAESLKVLVLSGDGDSLRSRDWAPMIRTIGQVWSLALRAKYNLPSDADLLGREFGGIENSAREALAIANLAVQSHKGSIPAKEFENVIDELNKKDLLPRMGSHVVKVETLKDLLPKLFGKLLYGNYNQDIAQASKQFGAVQLKRLTEIVDDWLAGQKLINTALNGHTEFSYAAFGKSLASRPVVRSAYADDTTYAMAVRAQKEMLLFASRGRPMIHDDGWRLIVGDASLTAKMHKADLNWMNAIRTVMTALIAGWTHTEANAKGIVGLTDTEVQELYLDLRTLGRDLNFIDIRSNTAGTRTFMENAIFMSVSDGNAYMGLQESIEWFNFVTSGSRVADPLYAQMQKTCATDRIDVLGNPKLKPDCFRREFLRQWRTAMPNLPNLISWVSQDGSGQRAAEMLMALENAGRNRGASNDLVDSSEFRAMLPILHYLESIFARFDTNHSQVLDDNEINAAFPLLAPFIKKMGNGNADSESMQRAVLSYIIEFGSVPSTDLAGMLKIGGWYVVHKLFSQSADRNKVLGIIGAFPAANKMNRVATIKAYYDEKKASLRALIQAKEANNASKLADLFQCLPEASARLAADMALNLNYLAPAEASLDDDTFVARMKAVMDKDLRLEKVCLPF